MSVHVYEGGDRSGRPMVFIHGAGMDHTVWRFQTRWLASRGFWVLAPDLPGHGRSGGPALDSIEACAQWVDDFLTRQGAEDVVLIGHSMGSLIGLEVAAASDRVGALVLVAGALRMPVHPVLLSAARSDLPRAAELIAGWSFPWAHRGAHPEPGLWQQGSSRRLLERSRPGVLATDLAACAAYEGAERATEIQTSATVVSGTADRMVLHRASQELVEALPRGGLVAIEGAGHEPMLETPHRFNREMIAILDAAGKAARL